VDVEGDGRAECRAEQFKTESMHIFFALVKNAIVIQKAKRFAAGFADIACAYAELLRWRARPRGLK
jgi:hypothetical protein